MDINPISIIVLAAILVMAVLVAYFAWLGLLMSFNNLYRRCTVCKKNIKKNAGHRIELNFGLIGKLEKDMYVCDECWQREKDFLLADLRQLVETPLPMGIHMIAARVDGIVFDPKSAKTRAQLEEQEVKA